MLRTQFTLIQKKQLTHDVYELVYSCPDMIKEYPKYGQYVMFQLRPGLNRAYSIASFSPAAIALSNHLEDQIVFTLIIKKIHNGRGSPLICDADIGTVFYGILPLGHFVLRDTSKSKCFIGTGTGFAPLYCQALGHSLREEKTEKIAFVFGVRNLDDSFYEREILKLGENFKNFEYIQYFSRVSDFPIILPSNHLTVQLSGYVTDWINAERVKEYQEYYICGSPAMVHSAREKLEILGVKKENIFWEQF